MNYSLTRIELRGTPQEMGTQHGQLLRRQIRDFVPMRLEATREYLHALGHADLSPLFDLGRQCMHVHKQWDLPGFVEHSAIAEAAGVDPVRLYTAANMTDVRDILASQEQGDISPADAEGCSTILLPGPWTRSGQVRVGQTWDLNPQDIDFVVAIRRVPHGAPQTWSLTCSGCLSLVGLNSDGLAVGTTNIKTRRSRPGVGYMGILHRMLRCRTFAQAAQVVEQAPRAAAHTYWLADAQQVADWECTAWQCDRRDSQEKPLFRTNHCLLPAHKAAEFEPASPSSQARLQRLSHLLATPGLDVPEIKEIFADRADGVDSLNRRAEDDQGTATNSVVVAEPAECKLWACRGPADRGVWQCLDFVDKTP